MLYSYDLDEEKRRSVGWLRNIFSAIVCIGMVIVLITNVHPLDLSIRENVRLISYNFDVLWWEIWNYDKPYSARFNNYSYENDSVAANFETRNRQRLVDANILQILLKLYEEDNGQFPISSDMVDLKYSNPIYLELDKLNYRVPADPYQFSNYRYISNGKNYVLLISMEKAPTDNDSEDSGLKYYSNDERLADYFSNKRQ
jgi:hypothetical protein